MTKVIKFGGTVLQTKRLREEVIKIIKRYNGNVIVVCSAMGRMGFSYATQTLLSLVDEAYLKENEKARLLSVGELISTIILSNELRKKSVPCKSFGYENYPIIKKNNEFYCLIDKEFTGVFIVPGFMYKDEDNQIQLFDFGGSDLTATILADNLHEKSVSLYKEVKGIYPIYPFNNYRIEPYAYISYEEYLALIEIGYAPVNKDSVLYAMDKGIEMEIQRFDIDKLGTIIGNKKSNRLVLGVSSQLNWIYIATFFPCRVKEEVEELLSSEHIFIKETYMYETYLKIRVTSSQILQVKRKLVHAYFE